MAVRDSLQLRRLRTERDLDAVVNGDYQLRVAHETEDPAWDTFLAETPGGHHVQTSLWAQVRAAAGWRAVRVVARRGDGIVAGAQVLIRPLPLVGAIGYVPRGPLG